MVTLQLPPTTFFLVALLTFTMKRTIKTERYLTNLSFAVCVLFFLVVADVAECCGMLLLLLHLIGNTKLYSRSTSSFCAVQEVSVYLCVCLCLCDSSRRIYSLD